MNNFKYMKVIKTNYYENKEKGVNVYILKTDIGLEFKGIARCKKEDMKYYSSILGGSIAICIAEKKYYAALIKYVTRFLKDNEYLLTDLAKKEYEQDLVKAQICYNKICKDMPTMIENYYKSKKRIENYLERKRKGQPLTIMEDLQLKANKLRKMAKEKK